MQFLVKNTRSFTFTPHTSLRLWLDAGRSSWYKVKWGRSIVVFSYKCRV